MPAFAHIGEMRQRLFVVLATVRPVYHCHIAEAHKKKEDRRGVWRALLSNLSHFGLYNHKPHVARPPLLTHTSPYLPFGHGLSLYELAWPAKNVGLHR